MLVFLIRSQSHTLAHRSTRPYVHSQENKDSQYVTTQLRTYSYVVSRQTEDVMLLGAIRPRTSPYIFNRGHALNSIFTSFFIILHPLGNRAPSMISWRSSVTCEISCVCPRLTVFTEKDKSSVLWWFFTTRTHVVWSHSVTLFWVVFQKELVSDPTTWFFEKKHHTADCAYVINIAIKLKWIWK